MVRSDTLVKLSSPLARSCLVAIAAGLLIDAALTALAAGQYPYLVDVYVDHLYLAESRSLVLVYGGFALATVLMALSTGVASYRKVSTYVLVHAAITGVFLPVSILVYFSTAGARYKPSDHAQVFRRWVAMYRIDADHADLPHPQAITLDLQPPGPADPHSSTLDPTGPQLHETATKSKLASIINLMDLIQDRLSCCGVESTHDWSKHFDNFIAPTCCAQPANKTDPRWAALFHAQETHQFAYCTDAEAYQFGCLLALKEDEASKYAWLCDLIIFTIVATIANTVLSLLLFGLTKTEDDSLVSESNELSIVGVVSRLPRPSQPTITSIKHRPSVFVPNSLSQTRSLEHQPD